MLLYHYIDCKVTGSSILKYIFQYQNNLCHICLINKHFLLICQESFYNSKLYITDITIKTPAQSINRRKSKRPGSYKGLEKQDFKDIAKRQGKP